jgi:hypothetical protein
MLHSDTTLPQNWGWRSGLFFELHAFCDIFAAVPAITITVILKLQQRVESIPGEILPFILSDMSQFSGVSKLARKTGAINLQSQMIWSGKEAFSTLTKLLIYYIKN